MRKVLILLLMTALMSVGCGKGPAKNSDAQRPWSSGGTLHNATVRQWLDGTKHNRIATAGDMMTIALVGRGVAPGSLKYDEMKQLATKLEACITAALKDGAAEETRIRPFADPCIDQLIAERNGAG